MALDLIKFVIKDTIEDFKVVWKIITCAKYRTKASNSVKDIVYYIKHNFVSIIKTFWLFYLLCFGFLCVGYVIGHNHGQVKYQNLLGELGYVIAEVADLRGTEIQLMTVEEYNNLFNKTLPKPLDISNLTDMAIT